MLAIALLAPSLIAPWIYCAAAVAPQRQAKPSPAHPAKDGAEHHYRQIAMFGPSTPFLGISWNFPACRGLTLVADRPEALDQKCPRHRYAAACSRQSGWSHSIPVISSQML